MPSASVGLGSLSRGGEGVDTVVTTTKTPVQGPIPESFAQNAIISWFRGEFAAANAIIDALCSHLANLDGTNSGVVGSGYESVFAAIHRRRLNWIPILQMQTYHSIAEVPIELKKVAAKKSENVKVKIDLHDDVAKMIIGNEEVKRIDEKSTKVYEIDAVEEEDSPDSEITDGEVISLMEINNNNNLVKRLRCCVQNYDWGAIGYDSGAARLFSLNSGQIVDEKKSYAEFWMGTHPSGPSYVVADDHDEDEDHHDRADEISLRSWILQNPNVFLGDQVAHKWNSDLPFLFKVLSVAKALSIQAHPDKEWARALHKLHPEIYKDDNHKPEMTLAITDFEALCGFVSVEELKNVFRDVPEIVQLVGSADIDQFLLIKDQETDEKAKSILQSIFTKLMSVNKEAISKAVLNLRTRLHIESQVRLMTDKEQLVLLLEKQYPEDIGVISAFFFNYVKLKPGEAIYLGANEPHAYLRGECIECMATSDNVVRAGLTPKLKDIKTLCSILTYKQGLPDILHGVPLNEYTKRYIPPFEEFEVDCCILPMGASTVFPAVSGPSLFLVTVGEGTMHNGQFEEMIFEGDVLFAPAKVEISVSSASEMQIYRAGVNSNFFSALDHK